MKRERGEGDPLPPTGALSAPGTRQLRWTAEEIETLLAAVAGDVRLPPLYTPRCATPTRDDAKKVCLGQPLLASYC